MAPAYEFPAPVLSVAADVVRELKGDDALTGLWTLFTKCKASLRDGHRLENISWRLWHRELAMATPRLDQISESEHDKDGNRLLDEKAALITEQRDNCSEMEHIPSTHVLLSPYSVPMSSSYPHPKSPTLPTVGPISTRCNSSFGRIIIDMLPNPLPPTTPSHPRKEMLAETDSSPLSYFTLPQSPAPAPAPDTHTLPIRCHLPTPAGSELYLMPPSTSPTQSSAAPVPQVQVQVDPAPTSIPPAMLPQLVIVHPTPGPTPHPTPPASPILGFGTTSGNSRPLEVPSTAETVAAPSPKFTLRAEETTTSSSSDTSSTSGRIHPSSSLAMMSSSESRPLAAATPVQQVRSASSSASSTSSSSIIAAPPPPPRPSASVSATPRPTRTPAPTVKKTHSSPTSRLSPTPATDAEPSRARPRAQPLRQTNSTSNVTGTGSSSKGNKDQRNKSKSRSRSRGRGADGPVRAGLMMTTATGKRGASATTGGGHRGRAVGLRKGVAGKGGANGRGANAKEKRPTFNIGSHSDDVGSKSAGSGSSFSGAPPNGAQHVEEGKKESLSSLVPPQRPASASRLMPPSLRPLPDPATVLPSKQQQPRRTIVLATSDSDDYETETDITESESEHGGGGGGGGARRVEVEEEGDTADWSSEDMSTDDVQFVRRGGATQAEPGHDKRGHVHPQHRSNSTANLTATNNHVHANNTTHNRHRPAHHHQLHHLSRAQQSRRNHAANAQYVVEQAALEAERLRDMFAKKPVPSSEDLVKQRTGSVGLLTQLMHPDPEIFPPSHPYRRGHSSGDLKGSRGIGVLGGGLAMTRASENEVGQRARLGQGRASTRKPEVQPPQRRASAGPAPGIRSSKSSAAIPVASQVQVGSVSSLKQESVVLEGSCRSDSRSRSGKSGAYRPKGRPADLEMEDTESEGESGDAANGILVSKSVAQEKLRALAARRGIVPNERKEEEEVPDWARVSEVSRKGRLTTSPTPYHHNNGDVSSLRQQQQQQQQQRQQQQPQAPTPTPIPLGHPYNLPPAAPPSTPRTTRRLMLQTEMSESLRRNLLWERQVSKVNLGVKRSASGGGSGKNGGTLLGGGLLKPLTALPSMVQLTAKQSGSGSGSGSNTSPQDGENAHPGSGGSGGVIEERERDERKKRTLAKNRSWANEFHYTGW